MEAKFNHFDHNGNAVMVDVSDKAVTERTAVASGKIRVNDAVMQAILQGTAKKGDVLGVARVAGIMATKQTSNLIPMCHLLCLNKSTIDFEIEEKHGLIKAICTVKVSGKTGVEMEALMGVNVTLLTIYDMCKAMDRAMEITDVHLEHKEGGKSGIYDRRERKKPLVVSICGCKNSGKTTFIERLLPILIQKQVKTAVVKHDGHSFEPDVEGTDSYRIRKAGACAVAVFCDTHSMVVKQKAGTVEAMLEAVDEADLVLLEGGKNWDFPKIELVRKGNSERLAGNGRNLLAVATDMEGFQVEKAALGTCGTVSEDGSAVPVIALDDYKKAADLILELLAGGQEAQP